MKRWLRTILIFLLLGAVVNVAVAWGFCLSGIRHRGGRDLPITRHDAVYQSWVWDQRPRPDLDWHVSYWAKWGGHPARCGFHVEANTETADLRWMFMCKQYLTGWPFRSFEGQTWSLAAYDIEPSRTALYETSVKSLWFGGSAECLDIGGWHFAILPIPTRPIWPAFAINTVIYAISAWLMKRGSCELRRFIRRKRGRCITCGYDLRGDLDHGCPECGWKR